MRIERRQLIGLAGSVLLFIGVFFPIIRLPLVGDMNYFQNGEGGGAIVLGLAVLSASFVLVRRYQALWLTGTVTGGVLVFTLLTFYFRMSQIDALARRDLEGNPFAAIGEAVLQRVQIQWGWAVLLIGAALVIGSAVWEPDETQRSSVFKKLIVVAGAMVLAALSSYSENRPSAAFRSHKSDNEYSAIHSIMAIDEAEMIYASSHPDGGFTPDLSTLGRNAQGSSEQTIDNNLAGGRKSGYSFTYTPGEKVKGAIRSYTITAVPDQVGTTGERRFYSDETGEIRYNGSGPANANSPEVGQGPT